MSEEYDSGWSLRDVDWRDVVKRAAKTFVQTFLATTTVGALIGGDVSSLHAALVSAGSCAISVLWNAAAQWAEQPGW